MKHNQRVGKWGEDAVAAYLAVRGYEIVARNVQMPLDYSMLSTGPSPRKSSRRMYRIPLRWPSGPTE